MKESGGPLAGMVVADFSHVLSGPYATMTLGDLGADVIRIEQPGQGDQTRGWGPPFVDGQSAYFLSVNRNKRSVALDVRSDEGLEVARALIDRADVLVQNFRPGVMEDLGLDYDTVSQTNPGLVYCSISAFGTTEQAVGLPGYDLLVQAASGLMSITGTEEGQPVKVGVAVADVITGLNVAVGALAALHHRAVTGRGQHVEVSLFSSMLAGLVNQASTYLAGGGVPRAMGMRHPSIAPYECFTTRTRQVIIAVGTDRQFAGLCTALGLGEIANDPKFATNEARVAHRHELFQLLNGAIRQRDADDLINELVSVGVPCGPINSIKEAFEFAEKIGVEPIAGTEQLVGPQISPQVSSPIHLSETPVSYRRPPPRLGEHTVEVLDALGLSREIR